MFENAQIIDYFLDYWRKSGHQRIEFLYGRYDFHESVLLGIRATVSAIYEPSLVKVLNNLFVFLINNFYSNWNHLLHKKNLFYTVKNQACPGH
jgi:hypothetical protein